MEEDSGKQADSPFREPAFRERLRDLEPSAKLVARTLHDDEPLTREQILERSLLHARTFRDALTHLEEATLVETRQSDPDGNTAVYRLTSPTA